MAADVRGYYSALGLNAGAPIEAVRSAYRRLAKECHPDRPTCVDGGQRFRRIAEAHDALSNPSFKAAYDTDSIQDQPKETAPPPKVEPIKCEVCGAVTAQPRRLAFWRVTSFILASQKTPIQKIFCQTCARKEQWISTIWTALLGWWGVPWGPVWASSHGIRNAVGGAHQEAVDDALLWQNAVAFGSRGDGPLAVGLANILRKSANAEIAQHAADVIRFFSERGIDASTTLKDVWKQSVATTAVLLLIAFAVPAAVFALILVPSTRDSYGSGPPSVESANEPLSATPETTPTGSQAVPAAASVSPPEPTCAFRPSNGQILVDHRGRLADGHHLKIENGTAGDAIIKMRVDGGKTLASFFVARGQTATLTGIPDGSYTVQYASGDKLAKNCRTFVKDGKESANSFPGPETLETRYEDVFDGTSVVHSELTYTLYPVPGGTVQPNSINMDEFNKP